jgi:hypothetical protein
MVKAPKDHLHGNVREGAIQRFGDRIDQVGQYRIQPPGGPDWQFHGVLGATPERGKPQQSLDHPEGLFYAPSLPVKHHGIHRRKADRIEFVTEIPRPRALKVPLNHTRQGSRASQCRSAVMRPAPGAVTHIPEKMREWG